MGQAELRKFCAPDHKQLLPLAGVGKGRIFFPAMVLPYQPHTSLSLSARTPRCYQQVPTSVAEGASGKECQNPAKFTPVSSATLRDGLDWEAEGSAPSPSLGTAPTANSSQPTAETMPAWELCAPGAAGLPSGSCLSSRHPTQDQPMAPAPLEASEGVWKPCWKHSHETQILGPTQRDVV